MGSLPAKNNFKYAVIEWNLAMNYYEVLYVDKTASSEEIKKAYRRLSRKYHPDNAGEQSRTLFDQVQEAYAVLGDEEKRAVYDKQIAGGGRKQQDSGIRKEAKQKSENNYVDMTAFFSGKYQNSFEQFFGFKPEEKEQIKGTGPVNTNKLFESFFKMK